MKRLLARASRAPRAPKTQATVVAILGMHRSGTSWLAGSLQHLGLELGEVNTSARHNLKGNRENRSIQVLHESVLAQNGGSWRDPRWPNRWPRRARTELERHIAAMSDEHQVWGFKDPRTLLVLDEWRRQIQNLRCVGIYRHPTAVFDSLRARHPNFTREEAAGLWNIYNERLIEAHRADPFPVLRFDVDASALMRSLAAVAGRLGLSGSDDPGSFFDENLVHNARAEESLPPETLETWKMLEDLAFSVGP